MRKKKVLFVSECHGLASGFGTYAKQVLPRLAATGKYELAEFASYGKPENGDVDWLYFCNSPETGEEQQLFAQNQANHFGFWRFDKVVLTFKPDIVLTYRDPWMDEWIAHSPLRPFFNWVWMPTVDSAPQKRKWLETFSECDALLAYSEFGVKTLKEQSNNTLNVLGCASPAIDPNLYTPVPNKKKHKEKFNLPPDINIVGTVMRNQRRKLFFELMKAFKLFLETAPPEVAEKTFLYLHTSYPEPQGWDIAEGVLEFGLSSKVLTTYICRHCGDFHSGIFQDAITVCPSCNNRSAVMPSVGLGLSIPDLIKVYNLFDMYVQYAICEGFGMPQVEAAACGVPIAAVNYSAMEDVVGFTNGYPINVKSFYRELETGADRAHPDNEHLAQILTTHFSLSEEERNKKCYQTRMGTIKRYDWDRTAKVWEDAIDNAKMVGLQGKWDSPPRQIRPLPPSIPDIPDNEDLVRWSFAELLQEPEKAYSFEATELAQILNFGAPLNGQGAFNRDNFWDIMRSKITSKMQAESVRTGQTGLVKEKFLEDAYRRFQK
jgi:glycosyltransferase involved in cell wall biosynthesis